MIGNDFKCAKKEKHFMEAVLSQITTVPFDRKGVAMSSEAADLNVYPSITHGPYNLIKSRPWVSMKQLSLFGVNPWPEIHIRQFSK